MHRRPRLKFRIDRPLWTALTFVFSVFLCRMISSDSDQTVLVLRWHMQVAVLGVRLERTSQVRAATTEIESAQVNLPLSRRHSTHQINFTCSPLINKRCRLSCRFCRRSGNIFSSTVSTDHFFCEKHTLDCKKRGNDGL